jgi:hypothetical protein
MLTMARERVRKIYVRTTTRLKGSLERLKGNLRGSEPYLSRETVLSQEAIINASWMWMADMDPADLAKALAPYIAKFEALWGEGPSGDVPGQVPQVNNTKVIPGPKSSRRRGTE